MRHVALIACFVTAALAGPLPQQRYNIRRPQGAGVPLHTQAQAQNNGQQFIVTLDDNSREIAVHNLQGVGNFATAQVGVAASNRQPQNLNVAGNAQFHVQVDTDDNDSFESGELRLAACPEGQLRHGSACVVPRINRNIFVFGKDDVPEPKAITPVALPIPQLDYNIIFVRSRPPKVRTPLVVPPPQKKTVVYVLEDEVESAEGIIESPVHPDADPEVYYVKVRPGENPQLPGGLDLQTAYSQAIRPLQGFDNSLESSVELTIGGGHGAVGVPLPAPTGGASFAGQAQGSASFHSAGGGPASVGVPLPATNGGQSFGAPAQDSAFFHSAGGNGAAGFGDQVGVPLPAFNNNGHLNGFNSANGASVGVPLPSFQGNAEFNAGGGGGGAGFGNPQGPNPGPNDQAFSGSAQFTAESTFGGAKKLEVDINDGRLEIEPASQEAVQQAIRYQLPDHV